LIKVELFQQLLPARRTRGDVLAATRLHEIQSTPRKLSRKFIAAAFGLRRGTVSKKLISFFPPLNSGARKNVILNSGFFRVS
jgi:hypothetical protein